MNYYRGNIFPHRAVVLLPLKGDGVCNGLNGHCARETAVLVLVLCYKARGDREEDLWRFRLSERCVKQWNDKRSGYGCLGKKCKQGEEWSSDLAVSHIQAKLSDIQNENTRFRTYISPLPRIYMDVADRTVLPLLFLKSLCILSFCPIVNIRSCHQDRKLSWVGPVEYHRHSGFHYS